MCKLCDKIYHCTETLPYLQSAIQRCPEGVVQLMVPWYDIISDTDGRLSRAINFCPECGKDLRK
jgi:hypothetical protein